jgi:hypothetical protein
MGRTRALLGSNARGTGSLTGRERSGSVKRLRSRLWRVRTVRTADSSLHSE